MNPKLYICTCIILVKYQAKGRVFQHSSQLTLPPGHPKKSVFPVQGEAKVVASPLPPISPYSFLEGGGGEGKKKNKDNKNNLPRRQEYTHPGTDLLRVALD